MRTLVATGDVIPARLVDYYATQKKDFLWPFRPTADYVKNADVTFANLVFIRTGTYTLRASILPTASVAGGIAVPAATTGPITVTAHHLTAAFTSTGFRTNTLYRGNLGVVNASQFSSTQIIATLRRNPGLADVDRCRA